MTPSAASHFFIAHQSGLMAAGIVLWLLAIGFFLALPILAVRSLRARDPRKHARFFELARIILGVTMVFYALVKPYLQLAPKAPPSGPIGAIPDFQLFWYFFSLKRLYVWFTCLTELLSGLLILWSPTRRFGLLLMCAIMANVTLLDFAYLHAEPVRFWALALLVAAASCLARELPLYLDAAQRLLFKAPPGARAEAAPASAQRPDEST